LIGGVRIQYDNTILTPRDYHPDKNPQRSIRDKLYYGSNGLSIFLQNISSNNYTINILFFST
jgi:hypothetical protein